MKTPILKRSALALLIISILIFGYEATAVAQTGIFIPLIGITSVPNPLALTDGPGNVTYRYAVKNFLSEAALNNVQVVDDKCSPVKFIEGDDNNNNALEDNETWRYTCVTRLSETTENTATATGTAFGLLASHQAFSTVVVGSISPAPLVSIVNVTKIPYPLSVTPLGNRITYTYRVNNPGIVPLRNVSVMNDNCAPMSGKLGDTNGNQLLDIDEVWIYSCSTIVNQTTTNRATVSAIANGLEASDADVLTVLVDGSAPPSSNLLDVGISPNTGTANTNIKIIVWGSLSGILAALLIFLAFLQKRKMR